MTDIDKRAAMHALWHSPLNKPARLALVFFWRAGHAAVTERRERATNPESARNSHLQRFRDDLGL